MPNADSKTALIPMEFETRDLIPSHQSYQSRLFSERRHAALRELRMFSGIPQLVRDLRPDAVYRLAVPDGEILQKGADGLYSGVLYRPDGRISQHARFERVPRNLASIASNVGAQILLISIAMQLNRIESAIAGISEELHNDRISEITGGVRQFELAMSMIDSGKRCGALQNAIQTLNSGLSKVCKNLASRIQRLPSSENTFMDNWLRKKSAKALSEFHFAEETLRSAICGVSVLSQCYAALDEPKAAGQAIELSLKDIKACGIHVAAEKARILEVKVPNYLPEAPWLEFESLYADFVRRSSRAPLDPVALIDGRVIVEFTKKELSEAL